MSLTERLPLRIQIDAPSSGSLYRSLLPTPTCRSLCLYSKIYPSQTSPCALAMASSTKATRPVVAILRHQVQPPATTGDVAGNEQKDELPVLSPTEPVEMLDVLLRFCLPRELPVLDDITMAVSALGDKIDWAAQHTRCALV